MNGNDCHLSFVRFLLPKAGLLPSECEDAIAFCHRQRRYCVADGATEAFDSRRWAKFLTKCWAADHRLLTKEEFEPWLANLGNRLEQRWNRRPLPWYAEEKARSGAFAAFVGVAFIGSEHGLVWQAVALGDSCLIHIRDNAILQAIPINEPEAFGYHPILIPSNPRRQQGIAEQLTISSGYAEPEDSFLLLTDAIAAWYLQMAKEDPNRINELQQVLGQGDLESFSKFVARERTENLLRNDDVALLRITINIPPSEATTD
jgi:hypothetical protein